MKSIFDGALAATVILVVLLGAVMWFTADDYDDVSESESDGYTPAIVCPQGEMVCSPRK